MPRELKHSEQFQKLIPKAVELRVFRDEEFVKLKLRTPDYLYTYKTSEDEADDIIKSAKDLDVIEFNPGKKEKSEEKKEEQEAEAKKSQQ
jgi:hypothetical protein